MNLISLFVTSILSQNIVLSKFLGICPFIGTSEKPKDAFHMGIAVTAVITLTSLITFLIYYYVLEPTKTVYLMTVMFILIIASMVQILDILLKRYAPKIREAFGIYLPLITTNCAVLGTTLLIINIKYTFIEALVFSLGSGIGFTLVIYIFSTIREKLEISNIPRSFKGVPIAFITAAIMAILLGRYVI